MEVVAANEKFGLARISHKVSFLYKASRTEIDRSRGLSKSLRKAYRVDGGW